MSKHNAYLKDENLLTLFSLNNMIVPEIQREYVWGNNSDVLEKFLVELEKKAAPCEECHHVHGNKNINVGFLYSYKPSYVKHESERILDEFLIDGQQRITTLFLLLLFRATIEDRIDDFMAICRADEDEYEMGFNYKVRSLTQKFLMQLIKHAKREGNNAFDFIVDLDNTPHWFLDDYKNDPTVMSMISALRSIRKTFGNTSNYYFDYLLTNIHFWHFKTEATSQGEELYITMNSRGEQLSDNEMQKSRVLPSSDLFRYGREWESWQTFFWRNRNKGNSKNANADKGFNNFLACIEGLECFNEPSLRNTNLNVETLQTYIKGLIYICSPEFRKKVSDIYTGLYTSWFDSFIFFLWNELNTYDGRWDIIDPRGGDQALRNDYKNKSIARNKSMLFWPWMTYFKKYGNIIDDGLLIQLLHFYYIRYQCYKRSSTSIETIVKAFIETQGKIHTMDLTINDDEEEDNVNSKTFSDEEILLSRLYYSDDRKTLELEASIWEIQELPYFLDGKGVGGNTVYDFFSDEDIIDRNNALESILVFKDRIINLLGYDDNKLSHVEIKRILLFYVSNGKTYWCQQSPWYYSNYETGTWKRIVRSPHFISFFKDFYSSGLNYDTFLEKKRKEFFEQDENKIINRNDKQWSHRKLVILYDLLSVNGGIWDSKHDNVVLWKNQETELKDEIFLGQDTIWKAARYYDSKAKICLSSDWQEILTRKYKVQIIDFANETSLIEDNAE
ncbi:MAG: DUF262 domain-containing protein [Paludibacteraceae bacterium]|nr:DUF262 domain-containing protein [Paludibacteraceae bacterium]